jgi:hypothetical protein
LKGCENEKEIGILSAIQRRRRVDCFMGEARLIKYLDGKVELKGGSKEDSLAAQEWISLFWHVAVGI